MKNNPSRMKSTFVILFIILMTCQLNGQSVKALLDTFPINKNFSKPANWKYADENRHFYNSEYPNSMNLEQAFKIIRTEKNFNKYLQAKKWCIDNYLLAIPNLLESLIDTTKVGLENSYDLIIWDRIETKEMKDYGHGEIVKEDLFTIAGRCSYILHELTGEQFALVHMRTTKERLVIYQEIWLNWFWQL